MPPTDHGAASGSQGHSEECFGASRDFWWNRDYLELTARRLKWAERRRVLEVGCGLGHWARAFTPFLASGTSVTCVDRDPKWAEASEGWVRALSSPSVPVRFARADAYALPFPDAAFDLVTCQTLLLHLADPRRALSEMLRVLEPRGLLLCVEPDNFAVVAASETSLLRTRSLEEEASRYRFVDAQFRGRIARGLGNFAIGGRLAGLFAALGLREISVRLSDRAAPLYPPYSGPEQASLLADIRHWQESGVYFDREEVRKNFVAGGGNPDEFESLWNADLAHRQRFMEAVAHGTYDESGGALSYVVAGLKADS